MFGFFSKKTMQNSPFGGGKGIIIQFNFLKTNLSRRENRILKRV